ncbi:TPA: fimbria/pilus periplasmic chaperone [Escherichia coli]
MRWISKNKCFSNRNINSLLKTQYVIRAGALFLLSAISINAIAAGGFGLGSTRLVYPSDSQQITLSVQNGGANTSYLIQSWIDDNQSSKKSQDFVVTPPLFMLPTRKKASLRIMFIGKSQLPTDRETLFWMNVKAIPPTDEKNTQKNTLQLALQNRIKLFYRPTNLPVQAGKARDMLRFKYEGKQLRVINPSPYYLTVTGIRVQGAKLPNAFVPPKSDVTVSSPVTLAGEITYQTINDYGATTARQKGTLQ